MLSNFLKNKNLNKKPFKEAEIKTKDFYSGIFQSGPWVINLFERLGTTLYVEI